MAIAAGMNEETHHKMSKKIAQLTKVIFHLYSKNEEKSAMHTSIQNAYEKEKGNCIEDKSDCIHDHHFVRVIEDGRYESTYICCTSHHIVELHEEQYSRPQPEVVVPIPSVPQSEPHLDEDTGQADE